MLTVIDRMSEDELTFWEKTASTSWGSYITDVEKRAILSGQQMAGFPATALEIGAEGGRWSKLLSDLGWRIICTDVNKDALDVCQRRLPDAQCIFVDPNDSTLPCATNSIRLLICMEVAPVIQSNWFATEASRVLERTGIIIGSFWNRRSLRGSYCHAKAMVSGSFDWYKYPYSSFRQKLARSGFRIEHEEGLCWFPFQRNSNSSLVPFFVKLERTLNLHRIPKLSPSIVFIARKVAGNGAP